MNGRSQLIAALVLAVAAGPAFPLRTQPRQQAADFILTGGQVRTPTGWAEALAVRGELILAVGDATSVARLRGPRTRVIPLAGRTVLPGLHDTHVHPIHGGINARRCRVPEGANLAEALRAVQGCAAQAAPGEWILGRQWDAPRLGGVPDRRSLDGVAPKNPVLLDDTSGHSAWANSAALAAAGVTRETKDPPGGVIERDATGAPTGILREFAIELVRGRAPLPSQRQIESALAWSVARMLAVGITSFTEASLGFMGGIEREATAYAALADRGLLKQRVTLCLGWVPGDSGSETVIATRNEYARPRLAPDCVKMFLDGVPTDGHTAAMLQPYADSVPGRTDERSRTGMLLYRQEVLDSAVSRFDRIGLTVKFHAAGDAAVRAGLNAIAAARKVNGFTGLMHNVGHVTFVAKEDIARARAIGATFEVSPYLWGPSPINDAITTAVGEELITRVWPVREMLDAGAPVVPGSDWAVVPSVDPWVGIETLVTRQVPGGSPTSFGPAQAISVAEAIELFTTNAARQARKSDRLGRIEPGMQADLIVVDQNPYQVPRTSIHRTKVQLTFVGGEKVYEAPPAPPKRVTVEMFKGGFATVNSFLFSNGQALVLLDAQRKATEARKLADLIKSKGLPLTHILISHGHTDHFTGMALLHREFPEAKIVVANQAIKQDVKDYAIYMDQGGATGAEPALDPDLRPKSASNPNGFDYEGLIEVLPGNSLAIPGGGTLAITTDYRPTEAKNLATVYSPDLNAVFLSDLAYNRVHLWMGDDITLDRVATWRAELLKTEARYALRRPTIYPGHGDPTDLRLFGEMVRYIDDYTRIVRTATSQADAIAKMTARYPGYGEANFFLKYSVENHVKP
jgi:hypothetical protein